MAQGARGALTWTQGPNPHLVDNAVLLSVMSGLRVAPRQQESDSC